MADYDIGVIALTTPAAVAPLAPTRLVVSVKNNGVHDAVASGWARVYDKTTSLLLFETTLYSDTLAPGATGPASTIANWTPPAEGFYIIHGYLSTPLDQIETNNQLTPTTIEISGAEPPPETPVEPHASQHEEGGADEISIEGLPGRAADEQTPLDHASTHQAGGADQLNVGSLIGELATPQAPKSHGNAAHSPLMATSLELTTHQEAIAAHVEAANLANRDTSGPLLGLVPSDQLALGSQAGTGRLYLDVERYWHIPVPTKLICLWPAADPVPEGWQLEATPPPSVLVVYIQRIADP